MKQLTAKCAADFCSSLPWDQICRILESLPPNYLVLICRLICKEVRSRFSQPHHLVVRFDLPLPPFSCRPEWLLHLQQFLKTLTFDGKLEMLSSAASSGSEVNLELAWDMLRPCLAPDVVIEEQVETTDAGAAAVKSGHLHLLPWLLQHGCPLDLHATLDAAAEHCDLAGLQRVWELLGCGPDPPGRHNAELYGELVGSAAVSGLDTIAKITWLMAMAERSTEHYKGPWLLLNAATGAASSGRLPVLQWLLEAATEAGAFMRDLWSRVVDGQARAQPLARALGAGQLAAADWLVDEAGYPLPEELEGEGLEFGPDPDREQVKEREHLWGVTARGGSVDALRWLLLRGVPADSWALTCAVRSGHLGAVQFLHEECGVGLGYDPVWNAGGSRSVPTVQWLLQAGCDIGPRAYQAAVRAGDVAMIRWLALDAKCPWSQSTISDVVGCWTYEQGSSVDDLREAVRLLGEAGCPLPCDGMSESAHETVYGAAMTGHLPLLRYLHEELGVGLGPGTLTQAAQGGCEAVLEWLVGAGCRAGDEGLSGNPYAVAAENGDMATLQCLRRLEVPWGTGVVRGAMDRSLTPPSAVRWLVEQGAPLDKEAVGRARARARKGARWRECAAWLAARLAAAERCS